jgi:hypothetical protein
MPALTRHNIPVVLRWAGWEGLAVWLQEGREPPRWVAVTGTGKAAKFEPLPPKKLRLYHEVHAGEEYTATPEMLAARGWAVGPTSWRPHRPETWPSLLPEPLPVEVPESVVVSIGRVAFSATDAAAEMEADRTHARAKKDKPDKEALPWWRTDDLSEITYAPPGRMTKREVEGRVMRALYFLGGGGLVPSEMLARSNADVLADLKRAADLALGDATSDYVPHLDRTPADTDDRLLGAMRWVCEARATVWKPQTLHVLAWRSANIPLAWTEIGDRLKSSRQAAKDRYDRAIISLTRIANTGTPTLDRIRAEVIQGNRAHARANNAA